MIQNNRFMSTIYRELTKIKELIEELGFTLSYPFDDLLFIDSNAFLIQYNDEQINSFFLYFNDSLAQKAQDDLTDRITTLAMKKKMQITAKGQFQLTQKVGSEEELELKFILN